MTQQFTADLTLNLVTDVLNTPRSVTLPALTPTDVAFDMFLYNESFGIWIKNVALNAPMGHAVFNPQPYPVIFVGQDTYTEQVIATNVYARLVECRYADSVALYRVEYGNDYEHHTVSYGLFDGITVLHSFVD